MQRLKSKIVVFTALIIGPVLIVNSLFKAIFGRARPRDIQEFGGQLDFTPAGDIIGQCVNNCSFVSGEASAGGWLLGLGLLFAPAYRKFAYTILLAIGLWMALLRVAFGAHFLSDVLLGYLVSLIVLSALAITMDYFFPNKSQS